MKNFRIYVILAVGQALTSCTSIQSSFCRIKGGEPYVNFGGYQYCGTKYSDGGKECYSSRECQGDCVLPIDWNPAGGKKVVGRCRSNDTRDVDYGCLAIEDYEHESSCIEE
ncbi:hypothetical protein P886_1287 [Alteromonadaceae bacterium 2753L.S.0a.02]|nr:hypothetical protein P886_1287 [Alteromonadaceae bacterium 2753L.S.0a.02]